MARTKFTLEYWIDEDWYVGGLREVPGVFSQGETLRELEENMQDAYRRKLTNEMNASLRPIRRS